MGETKGSESVYHIDLPACKTLCHYCIASWRWEAVFGVDVLVGYLDVHVYNLHLFRDIQKLSSNVNKIESGSSPLLFRLCRDRNVISSLTGSLYLYQLPHVQS